MITLCSKRYFVEEDTGKNNLSMKGMFKARNAVTWGRFRAVLHGEKDKAMNWGFGMRDGRMMTYEEQKLGLSTYYDKRYMLPDRIYTEPVEYHT